MKTITLSTRDLVVGQPAVIREPLLSILPGDPAHVQSAVGEDFLLAPERFQLAPIRRLLLLVPDGEIDESSFVRRVWQLASLSGLEVLYLALSPDAEQTAYQRRRLAGLTACTTHPFIRADFAVSTERNWVRALEEFMEPGDLVVCLADHRVPGFLRRQALGDWLVSRLGVPVYKLTGLKINASTSAGGWIKEGLVWVASIAIIALFFWLQVSFDQGLPQPQATILLYLSILAELFCIWKINQWIG